jgi:hypothetical protein
VFADPLLHQQNWNHRPHGRESEDSGTEEVADNHHQYYQWRRSHLDQLAEHLSQQALPLQGPQQSGPTQLQSQVPLLSDADPV